MTEGIELGYDTSQFKAAPDADRENTYAEAIDPKAFDDAVPKSEHPAAVLQWAARRKTARDAAPRCVALADREQGALLARIARQDAFIDALDSYALDGGDVPSYLATRTLDAEAKIPKLRAEVERLRRWKVEATEVVLGLQDVGKALGLSLGERITGSSAAEAAVRLKQRAEAAEHALADERATVLGIAQRHATGAHARGDSEERRRWLDLCIMLERAALAGPAEPEANETVRFTINACPECRAGKHGNCDGTAWDEGTDSPTSCGCELVGHIPPTDGRA